MESLLGGMKDLTVAQECTRAVVIFFYGLVMLRLSGRRTFAHMSAVDLIISIIVGSNLSRAMTGDVPFWGTLASVAVLVALHVIVAYGAAKSPAIARCIEGDAVMLVKDGAILEGPRLGSKISLMDIEEALREKGLDGLAEISKARKLMLEPSGKISVIKHSPAH
jgi:uncharacterized membrane protein YcaP (DUF421 family)